MKQIKIQNPASSKNQPCFPIDFQVGMGVLLKFIVGSAIYRSVALCHSYVLEHMAAGIPNS